ncbi:cell division cycle protein 20 homolog isoform X2 [Chrysoperla carnea]|uniref:cell division cycle protein 20 homolog isoform X2 n=1 Tax=Chrysoperla carnea TaxID=189513 RepID=UPI001D064B90|nr:cell division cycle protein 20 homolog isoform X2 [Chrysoperla carnea]
MAQFKYMNELSNVISMDGPISKGPVARWQRKGANSNSDSNTSSNTSNTSTNLKLSSSSFNSTSNNLNKTPKKNAGMKNKKTPSKTPSKNNKSPGRSKTPNTGDKSKTPTTGDRFIPLRSTTNFDLAHYKISQLQQNDENSGNVNGVISPTLQEKQRIMCENLHGNDISKQRILEYKNKAPLAPEGYQNHLRVVYTQTRTPASTSVKSNTRYIPQQPDRILDAPDIIDDYYLNLIDWSSNNILAVALGAQVYLWNADTGNIQQLMDMQQSTTNYTLNDHVCSLNWIQDGDHLAVGLTNGSVELWDCVQNKKLRTMFGHRSRVSSLSWNSYVLTSGCRTGEINHNDVRQRDHLVKELNGGHHTQDVCGLKWSPDGKYLASGGNDNILNIWSLAGINLKYTNGEPLYSYNNSHTAAVKALAWCPYQPNVLASGGGTADRTIKFWNCNTGALLNSVDTKSQVCSILFSTNYKELISGHGFANNQLIIWKYPSMTKITELTGHTARVLHLAMSPDGQTVLSAGADETLRLWKCFQNDPNKSKKASAIHEFNSNKNKHLSLFKQSIR